MNTKLKALILSGAALSLWGGSALAADISPAASSWTGVYFGVGGGGSYNFADVNAGGYGFVSGDTEGYQSWDGAFEDHATGTVFGQGDFSGNEGFYAATSAQIGRGAGFADVNPEFPYAGYINDILNGLIGGNDNEAGKAGAFGLAKIGADWQVGSSFVIGLAADYRFGSAEMKQSAGAASDAYSWQGNGDGASSSGALDATVELENSWSVGARAGFLPADNILLFVSGGYASAKASLKTSFHSNLDFDLGNADGEAEFDMSSNDSKWLHGFYVGGGADLMLTDNIMAGVEYRYVDLGSLSTSKQYEDCCNLGAGGGVGGDASLTSHSISATISYKFGL